MDYSTLFGLESLIPECPKPPPLPPTLLRPYQELKKSLKKKVSDIIAAPPCEKKAAAGELLNVVIEQRRNLSKTYKASKVSLHEQFKCSTLSGEQFLEQLRSIQRQERKHFAGDVTIVRNRERVLRNMQALILQHSKDEDTACEEVINLFAYILVHKCMDKEPEKKMFTKDLIGHYECQPGGSETETWCPIYRHWCSFDGIKAVQRVPFKLGYQIMGDIFGEEGRGHELVWSMGNGMMMHENFEEAFEEHTFCLVPIEKPGQLDGLKIILINEEKRFSRVGSELWDFYDGKELEFLNDQRPSRRFLYFHYVFCIYRAMKARTKGWQKVRDKSGSRQLWAMPGPYLRVPMLKKLAELIGDETELPGELLADGELMEAKPLEEETEALDAKDLASALLSVNEFNGSDIEDDDYF